MPTDRSARRVLSAALGITAIFDLAGLTVYESMRPVLPPSPPRAPDQDPFAAALATIMAARPQSAERAHDESGDTLAR
ncbi:MAG: hypothetical protein J2P28_07895 [Actinobacteria bacterium]|nr:hypothetical protein [Actinomycetota bacterium]